MRKHCPFKPALMSFHQGQRVRAEAATRNVSKLISTVTPPGKQKNRGKKLLKREEKSRDWNRYIMQTHSAPSERTAGSTGSSISTQGGESEGEEPSGQIKFPTSKWPRQPKCVREETSSAHTLGAGA